MFNLEGLTGDNSIRVVVTRRLMQESVDVQRDIYESHRHRIFALAFYMTGNEIEAEEILTATFVKAFRDTPEPEAGEVDLALMAELRQRFPLDQGMPPSQVSSGERASLGERNVRRTDLEEAIQTLPPGERVLFLLRDVEGYSSTAVAELLQIPETKVQRGLLSARIRLRQSLAARPSTESAHNPQSSNIVQLPVPPLEPEQDAA
ncbi:MAG: sigma-70 family RNA polymerase sigma factor [Acidobacteriaceae bacterium]|nr:sigma-70 family RNA polymerase sigma factor [Acidobacteriaceae bacterium]